MLDFKIKYTYHYDWSYKSKCGAGSLTLEEALKKYNNNETIFVVAQKENEDKPFAYMMIANRDSFYINYLNHKLDINRKYMYKILYNLDKNKLFLSDFMIKKYDYTNDILIKYIIQVDTYSFAKNNEESNFQWFILDKVYCEETNYIKEEKITYESKNIVDENSLWEDIPEFGNWDNILREDTDRIKFIEVND